MNLSAEMVADVVAPLTRWDMDSVIIASKKLKNVVKMHTRQRRQLHTLAIYRSKFTVSEAC